MLLTRSYSQLRLVEATAKNASCLKHISSQLEQSKTLSHYQLQCQQNTSSVLSILQLFSLAPAQFISGQRKPSRCLPKNVPCICKARLKRRKRHIRCIHWPATRYMCYSIDTQIRPRGLQKSSGATGPRLARESCSKACTALSTFFSLLNGPRNIIGDPLACPKIK